MSEKQPNQTMEEQHMNHVTESSATKYLKQRILDEMIVHSEEPTIHHTSLETYRVGLILRIHPQAEGFTGAAFYQLTSSDWCINWPFIPQRLRTLRAVFLYPLKRNLRLPAGLYRTYEEAVNALRYRFRGYSVVSPIRFKPEAGTR